MSERVFIGDLFVFTYGIATRFVIVIAVLFSAHVGAALLKHIALSSFQRKYHITNRTPAYRLTASAAVLAISLQIDACTLTQLQQCRTLADTCLADVTGKA